MLTELLTVAETQSFMRQAESVWNEEEREAFIDYIARNPQAAPAVHEVGADLLGCVPERRPLSCPVLATARDGRDGLGGDSPRPVSPPSFGCDRTHACNLAVFECGRPNAIGPPAGPWRRHRACSSRGMHAIFFGLKRAWHGSLRISRRPLAAMGLTAARFDLLYALQRGEPPHSRTQRRLRLTLGVNRTTISRMLASLESLGFVTRERSFGDRRTRTVELTELGLRRIRLAIRSLIGDGAAQLAVDSAIAGGPGAPPGTMAHDDRACLVACEVLESFLGGMRETYGDVATLHYPWHPDD